MINLDDDETELLESKAVETLKLKLPLECLRHVELVKSIADKMEPLPGLRNTIIKSGWHAILFGVFVGILERIIADWFLSTDVAEEVIHWLGFSDRWVAPLRGWVPGILALLGCARATAFPIVNEANEDRVRLETCWHNAHVRTMVLGSMLDAVDDLLPDALPLRDEHEHKYDDDKPSPFVRRILAQRA